jgi:hypothetical protein
LKKPVLPGVPALLFVLLRRAIAAILRGAVPAMAGSPGAEAAFMHPETDRPLPQPFTPAISTGLVNRFSERVNRFMDANTVSARGNDTEG